MKKYIIEISKNMKSIGRIQFGINKNARFISNIRVDENYRKTGLGTSLLKNAEDFLINNYKINRIEATSYNSIYEKEDVNDFFEKNNYKVTKEFSTSILDDEHDIFIVTPIIKKLYP